MADLSKKSQEESKSNSRRISAETLKKFNALPKDEQDRVLKAAAKTMGRKR